MDIYVYKAIDIYTQEQIKGEMLADNEGIIYNKLIAKDLYPKVIKKKSIWRKKQLFKPKIRTVDLALLCKQFSSMLGAGISIIETLEICKNQCMHRELKKHLESMTKHVREGKALWLAMEEEKIFPNFMLCLIECGEQTGHLVKAVEHIEDYLNDQIKTQDQLKKALTYPIIVLGLVSVVIVLMVLKIIPTYVQLLEDMGGDMPLPTQIVIQISTFISKYWAVIGISLFTLGFVFYTLYQILEVRAYFEAIYLKIPLLNKLIQKTLSAHFAGMIAMMIDSGVPILEALEMTEQMMHYSIAKQEIKGAIKKLEAGSLLADTFKNSKVYLPILLSMIRIGEESHTLPDLLDKMEHYFKGEATKEMEQIIVWVQPILMILIGLILGGMMAAILLPTFSAVTSVL